MHFLFTYVICYNITLGCLRFKKPIPAISNSQSFSIFYCFVRGKPNKIVIFKLSDVSIIEVTGRTIQCKYASFNRMTEKFELFNNVYWTLLNSSSLTLLSSMRCHCTIKTVENRTQLSLLLLLTLLSFLLPLLLHKNTTFSS